MSSTVYGPGNWGKYCDLFLDLANELDIYYHPGFLETEALLLNGEPYVFTFADHSGNLLLYPYIKRRIQFEGFENYFDITSPYGYCGPIWQGADANFRYRAESELCDYLVRDNVINEFVRYHYLFNKEISFSQNIENIRNRKLVIVQTNRIWEDIWNNQYSQTNRRHVRRMEKENYCFYEAYDLLFLNQFIQMYYRTMDHANADKMYYFPEQYFLNLRNSLGVYLRLFLVEKDGIIFNAALFFVFGKIATYFLGARNLDFPKIPGFNYLMSSATKNFHEDKFSLLNLGGGTNDDPNNPLLMFKLNFSKHTEDFYIGKRVHLPSIHRELAEEYKREFGLKHFELKSSLLQFYR